MIEVKMNYKKIYDKIVQRALTRTIEGYTERHHIVPKSLGGSNEASNIVTLTAREHYLCHWLLAKHTNDSRMWLAFSMMTVSTKHQDRIKSGRLFEIARIARSKGISGNNNPMYGKKSACTKHTEETKEKIRLSKLGKKRAPFNRSSPSQETKDKISLANKGRTPHNKGKPAQKLECPHCKKMVDILNLNRWHNDNCKMKHHDAPKETQKASQ